MGNNSHSRYFSTSPVPFEQTYALFEELSRRQFPLIFAFLKNKDTTSFGYNLHVIAEKAISSGNILCGFEKNLIQAVSENFPDLTLCGCHVHYSQALFIKN